MSIVVQLGIGLVLLSAMMAALWCIQWRTGNAGVVDVGWPAGVGLGALLGGVAAPEWTLRIVLASAMAVLWSSRLAFYVLSDRVLGKPEDGRYQALRQHWGRWANIGFFWFFQAQGVLAAVFALPIVVAARNPVAGLTIWDLAGVFTWGVAIGGEALADRQLARFRARSDSQGKTCRDGLWRYSRHPNYFFEWLHWWSYVLVGWAAPFGWITFLGPALMLWFLFRVTGIPHTEAQSLRSRGDDYRDYQRTTSVFIPWFPKRAGS